MTAQPAGYIAMLRRHEGVRARVYKDTLGIETIGVGFNLRRPDARQRISAAGSNYDAVVSGKVALTDSQIDALLALDVIDCVTDLKTLAVLFDGLPNDAKEVLVDMRFQLGGAELRAFKNTLAAFRGRLWKSAAAGMRASQAYQQTPQRWEENARRIEKLSTLPN